jgi:hypothetical protein
MPPATLEAVILPGWMERDEAINYLREHCWFDPCLDAQQAEALWTQYHDRVQALPERNPPPPTRHLIPQGNRGHVSDFLKMHRGQDVTDVININPMELVIYQTYVVTDRADHHHNQAGAWVRKTLVIDRLAVQLPMRVEGDTLKLNLPHAEHMIGFQQDGAFRIQQGGGYVSRVDIVNGRLVRKAGYHRSCVFARAAMNEPEARDRCELVALTTILPPPLVANFPTHQGLRTSVFGSRPPLFSDFFDSDLAMTVRLRRKRWEAQIRIAMIDDP